MTTFSSLDLIEPIQRALADAQYTEPTPIQAAAIPPLLEGRDVLGCAQTGTGKTAAFLLPTLNKLASSPRRGKPAIRALVLTPTRELAAQIGDSFSTYSRYLKLRHRVIFGGVNQRPQVADLRRGVDVLVATPGRLLDLHGQGYISFDDVEFFVLDEADRMLDMGFIHDIRRIIAVLPKQRQTILFSATFSDDIRKLAKTLVHNPLEISVAPANSTASLVEQLVCPVDKKKKADLLVALIRKQQWQQVLVFTKTKRGANQLSRHLETEGITAAAIHGNKTQAARTKALAEFKRGGVRVLVATDIAARGLDIDQLPQVVNYELPNVPEDYVHRIGRTGRAGASGKAVSLVCADEAKLLFDIERVIRRVVDRETVPGFEPVHELPESRLPNKANKPRKPKQSRHKSEHKDGQRSSEIATGHKPPAKKPSTRRVRRKPAAQGTSPGAKNGAARARAASRK